MKKSIVLADDHAIFSAGMVAELEVFPDLAVVGKATNGVEAIALIKRLKPDGAVLDMQMPGANGLEAFMEAKRWSPDTRFAVLTGNATVAMLNELLNAGIDGLFFKTGDPADICAGIHEIIHHNRQVIAPGVRKALDRQRTAETLTARELEVLHAIARGLSNSQTAERLGVSAKTVDSHRTNLMRKMGVHSTASLLVRAMRDGLIDVAEPF